jgi:hypothetical protein
MSSAASVSSSASKRTAPLRFLQRLHTVQVLCIPHCEARSLQRIQWTRHGCISGVDPDAARVACTVLASLIRSASIACLAANGLVHARAQRCCQLYLSKPSEPRCADGEPMLGPLSLADAEYLPAEAVHPCLRLTCLIVCTTRNATHRRSSTDTYMPNPQHACSTTAC